MMDDEKIGISFKVIFGISFAIPIIIFSAFSLTEWYNNKSLNELMYLSLFYGGATLGFILNYIISWAFYKEKIFKGYSRSDDIYCIEHCKIKGEKKTGSYVLINEETNKTLETGKYIFGIKSGEYMKYYNDGIVKENGTHKIEFNYSTFLTFKLGITCLVVSIIIFILPIYELFQDLSTVIVVGVIALLSIVIYLIIKKVINSLLKFIFKESYTGNFIIKHFSKDGKLQKTEIFSKGYLTQE